MSSDHYKGTCEGKAQARRITLESLRLLGGEDNFNNSHHVSLAGWEAGELNTVREMNPRIKTDLLHAAETKGKRVISARACSSKILGGRIYQGDILSMIKERELSGKIGVMFLDVCGTIDKNIDLISDCLPHLKKGGVIAINVAASRDKLREEREEYQEYCNDNLRFKGRSREGWRGRASALILNSRLRDKGHNVFFALAINYMNNGTSIHESGVTRMIGMPMLTVVGRKMTYRNYKAKPAVFAKLGYGGKMEYAINPARGSRGARVPDSFQEYWESKGKEMTQTEIKKIYKPMEKEFYKLLRNMGTWYAKKLLEKYEKELEQK